MRLDPLRSIHRRVAQKASALIITLWVAFGLVSLALYFGHASSLDLRTADNITAGFESAQAIEGAARYSLYLLTNLVQPGVLPDIKTYQREAVPVGDATFWMLGRDNQRREVTTDVPYFSLVDEASKLNINTATLTMLTNLPRMTVELAAAIIDWRDTDSDLTDSGAEDDTYGRRNPPYRCKNAPFESLDELRLVNGADLEILYGEDLNENGALDVNENDGTASLPIDDRNGRLEPGILEYLTVFTKEPLTTTNGSPRVNLRVAGFATQLQPVLEAALSASRATQVINAVRGPGGPGGPGGAGGPGATFNSPLEFFERSGMTIDEFSLIESSVYSAAPNTAPAGLVNVNTASQAVLACIPGIGTDLAPTLVAYRQSNPNQLYTVAWAAALLGNQGVAQAGRYLTGRSYQFSADIAAVGHHGRGYQRTRFVFDLSETTARISFRQNLTDLGWALGKQVRLQQQQLAMNSR